jgi:anti-sigma factor RsiW
MLSDYIDGDLDPNTEAAVVRHLDECATCAKVRRELALLVDALHRLGASPDACALLWAGLPRRRRTR